MRQVSTRISTENSRSSDRSAANRKALPYPIFSGRTTVARLYYLLLKDLGVFDAAKEKAQGAQRAAEAAAKKKTDDAERARQDAERRAFQAAGLPYTQSAARANAPTSTSTGGSAAPSASAAVDGFVETTGAALADKGVAGLKEMLEKIRKAGGGVLFVDEVRSARDGIRGDVPRLSIIGCSRAPSSASFLAYAARTLDTWQRTELVLRGWSFSD